MFLGVFAPLRWTDWSFSGAGVTLGLSRFPVASWVLSALDRFHHGCALGDFAELWALGVTWGISKGRVASWALVAARGSHRPSAEVCWDLWWPR